MPECYIRGSTIKYLRIPDEIIDMVKEEVVSKGRGRGGMQQNKQQGKGRGGGAGRGKMCCHNDVICAYTTESFDDELSIRTALTVVLNHRFISIHPFLYTSVSAPDTPHNPKSSLKKKNL